ncbi:hypothetical protein ACSBR1_002388 [Camellia fascicularis]
MASFKTLKSTFLIIALLLSLQFSNTNSHGGDTHNSGDTSNVNLHSKGLILVKVWCLIIIFLSTFAGGISPYFLRWNESFLLLGTQFAGGVFLGYLITMLGDCVVMWVTKDAEREAKVEVEGGGGGGGGRAEEEERRRKEVVGVDLHPGFARTTSLGDTILLILALCFHSVFEGIAIGISSTKGDAWRNLWTISLHKIFAAIAMGIALLRMLPKRPLTMTAVYSFAFAISSPVGVGIGIAIDATTQGSAADWTYAISMGIACGVFIYVAINHLIAKGFKPQGPCYFDSPFFKFLAVLLGVGVMAVVMIWD